MVKQLALFSVVLALLHAVGLSFVLPRHSVFVSHRRKANEHGSFPISNSPAYNTNRELTMNSYSSYYLSSGKEAAISLKLVPPLFRALGQNSKVMSRQGGLLLDFTKSHGRDNFDWKVAGIW